MSKLPVAFAPADVERCLAQWLETAGRQDVVLAAWMREAAEEDGTGRALLNALFGNSPYLSHLLLQHPGLLREVLESGPDAVFARLMDSLTPSEPANDKHQSLMHRLRVAKARCALLTAIADIAGLWPLESITGALSDFAERALGLALHELLASAAGLGEITLPNAADPVKGSGLIILGMGKLGARELNYSSDIDLILFFEPGRLQYKGRHDEQHFMNRLAHELVQIMQERTRDGYVFRTDLRLRPDPASTPPAINVDAAYYYYESVGQNWERAAMIKARPVAGDREAGSQFLSRLSPFMWRRNLDFAALNDIHSIKRQMDTRVSRDIALKGHNVKLGVGGIREIEFYVQIHQLIWGGRKPVLRIRGTCETLLMLVDLELVDAAKAQTMREAYEFLRTLEHRLQMIADQQTHDMPETDDGIAHIAAFMGYTALADFERDFFRHLRAVHDIYASSFQSAEKLGDEGNLVFTGVSHDPDTLATLSRMGYEHPETVSEIVMGWHHGSKRATRTKRARELLTELMPALLKRLSETASPDTAFLRFNQFLTHLPAGVQLFSLFGANPHLLGLIADIMGSAPTLAERLSKSPDLLDAVLYADFYESLPSYEQLSAQLSETLKDAADFEEFMNRLHQFRNEKQFQVGVQMLKRMILAPRAGRFLADLADLVVTRTLAAVTAEFTRSYGVIKGGRFAIIALGKLGSREMTFSSDIDLVFVYDVPDFEALSDGEKSFTASVYYNRLVQRLMNTLSAIGREGRLYEVDTRLRPSGKQGLLAVSVQALEHYFDELAWTFEYMAFTRARILTDDAALKARLETFVEKQLARKRNLEKLRADVTDMRERVEKEFGTKDPWNIKYVRGGLLDLDFIAQYLMLRHAPDTLAARPGSAAEIFAWLKSSGRMEAKLADDLTASDRFLGQIFNMLRLCCDRDFDEVSAPPGLKKLLVESMGKKDFADLKKRLIAVEESVYGHYIALLK